jgi:pyruvate/2-oxoglutarate dehydrogenase complex dihydrolipoamide acyltransferase (E2) component
MGDVSLGSYGISVGEDEASIVTWYFDDGDLVDVDSVLCDVALAKSQFEIPSKERGRLRIMVAAEVPIHADTVIGRVEPS